MTIKADKFFDDTQDRFEFNSNDTVFVCFMLKEKFVALHLHKDDSVEDHFRFVNKSHKLKGTAIKIIGPAALTTKVKSIAEKFNCVIDKIVHKSEYKIILLPKQKKVLMEKAMQSAIPSVKKKIRLLIVDDSKSVRLVLRKAFSTYSDIEVVGELEDPRNILQEIEKLKPDVITLDLQMPHMDGIQALKTYLPKFPIPTMVISALSMNEGPMVFDALSAGAIDYMQKPDFDGIAKFQERAIEKIREMAKLKVRMATQRTHSFVKLDFKPYQDNHIVAIGASTGGTEALKDILTQLPDQIPPMVIVQHIPAVFSKALADRLNSLCPFEVMEGTEGLAVTKNRVIIAPGGKQMKICRRSGGNYYVSVVDAEPVNRHKPSVEFMFDSLTPNAEKKIVGVMLTGMGADGAQAMLRLKHRGAVNIAQDEETCVVFGMPQAAIKLGAVDKVAPLLDIPHAILEVMKNKKLKKAG